MSKGFVQASYDDNLKRHWAQKHTAEPGSHRGLYWKENEQR